MESPKAETKTESEQKAPEPVLTQGPSSKSDPKSGDQQKQKENSAPSGDENWATFVMPSENASQAETEKQSQFQNEVLESANSGGSVRKSVHWSPELESAAPDHINSRSRNVIDESNPYVSSSPAPDSPLSFKETMVSVRDTLGRWGKRVGEATKKAEVLSRNTWQHPKLAFCSDNPLPYKSDGKDEWSYYKVVIPLHQLKAVNHSASRANPAEKYIQVISVDNHEFWYMGFLNYEGAEQCLKEALQTQNLQSV